ncbi:DeoR/GlpR family DNA-binding transcription regulator [Dongia rigui]|uniref:DeoR/GlpR family DNA-binding transcription regulator n=1 Tax=Dongia rigui TaxID=940149 RepID=A0ABU5E2I5_9PROT|nr:DeoR/GlpR family DNA-binding transcription regulator [Dongia rigui]MDY0873812.1 DeoR/GlpR family DNA-binding transcription regulator [Dongia rigui]
MRDPLAKQMTTTRTPVTVRDSQLRDFVERRGFAAVSEIAAELGVSEITIRRDLTRLESQGLLVRTHGGALAGKLSSTESFDSDEPSFEARRRRNAEAKTLIGVAAAALIRPGATIGIDVGTTALELARQLTTRDDIKIFTNSVRAATLLSEGPAPVYLPGGQLRSKELSVHGSIAVAQLRHYWFDLAFIGFSGLTDQGLFDYSLEDTEIKRVYIERAAQIVALCDSSKFGRLSMARVGTLEEVDTLITDAAPPDFLREALERAEVKIIVARGDGAESALPT